MEPDNHVPRRRRASGKISAGVAAPLTGFDPRTSFWLCVIAAAGLLPFAFFHWISGNLFMVAIVSSLSLIAIALAIQIHRKGMVPPVLLLTGVTMTLTVLFAYIFSSNIDRQKQALHEMASVDPLTGARNRREMQIGLKHACKLRDRSGTPASLLIFDLDFFKQVNDVHGHTVGDRVLIDLVETVSKRLRTTDTLYRYGGEEFVILANGARVEDGRLLADSLCELVRGSRLGGLEDIRISIGVAEYLPPELPAAWLKRADEALYRAKANGRNRIEVA